MNPADANWSNTASGADWNFKSNATLTPWTGGDGTWGGSTAALGLNYGTFTYTTNSSSDPESWLAINVTAAYKAYIDGSNGGLVTKAVPGSNTGMFSGADVSLVIHSDADPNHPGATPGLLVTTSAA